MSVAEEEVESPELDASIWGGSGTGWEWNWAWTWALDGLAVGSHASWSSAEDVELVVWTWRRE